MRGLLRVIAWEWRAKGLPASFWAGIAVGMGLIMGPLAGRGSWQAAALFPAAGVAWALWSGYVWLAREFPLERLAGIPAWQALFGRVLCWTAQLALLEGIRQLVTYWGLLPPEAHLYGAWRELGLMSRESAAGVILGGRVGGEVVLLGGAVCAVYLLCLALARGNHSFKSWTTAVLYAVYLSFVVGANLAYQMWRRHSAVGAVLAALVLAGSFLGVWWNVERKME